MSNETIRVLLIEDEAFISEMYAEQLRLDGFTVMTALDGAKGLSLALTERPDIVLLDLILPEIDGFEVLERLRGSSQTAEVPVILLSNLNQPEQVKRGKALGATDYLVKAHVTPAKVVEKIHAVLSA